MYIYTYIYIMYICTYMSMYIYICMYTYKEHPQWGMNQKKHVPKIRFQGPPNPSGSHHSQHQHFNFGSTGTPFLIKFT